jgi:5-methylcytosine-specific restriction endonuclease McrA
MTACIICGAPVPAHRSKLCGSIECKKSNAARLDEERRRRNGVAKMRRKRRRFKICVACGNRFQMKRAHQVACSIGCGRTIGGDYLRNMNSLRQKPERPGAMRRVWFKECDVCKIQFFARRPESRRCSPACNHRATIERLRVRRGFATVGKEIRGYRKTVNDAMTYGLLPVSIDIGECVRWTSSRSYRVWFPQCQGCGETYASQTPRSIYCSQCNKHRTRDHRQAVRRSGQTIIPRIVHERDVWHCQMCGRATPERLRGTTNSRAPVVDHRVPIAIGGAHTYDNVQTACWKCNARKGAHGTTGQLPLFPGCKISPGGSDKKGDGLALHSNHCIF